MGRIEHRTEHIHMGGYLIQNLTYSEISTLPGSQAEKIHGYDDS